MTGYNENCDLPNNLLFTLVCKNRIYIPPPPPSTPFMTILILFIFSVFFFSTAIEVFHLVRKFLFIFQLKDDEKVFHLD